MALEGYIYQCIGGVLVDGEHRFRFQGKSVHLETGITVHDGPEYAAPTSRQYVLVNFSLVLLLHLSSTEEVLRRRMLCL